MVVLEKIYWCAEDSRKTSEPAFKADFCILNTLLSDPDDITHHTHMTLSEIVEKLNSRTHERVPKAFLELAMGGLAKAENAFRNKIKAGASQAEAIAAGCDAAKSYVKKHQLGCAFRHTLGAPRRAVEICIEIGRQMVNERRATLNAQKLG